MKFKPIPYDSFMFKTRIIGIDEYANLLTEEIPEDQRLTKEQIDEFNKYWEAHMKELYFNKDEGEGDL